MFFDSKTFTIYADNEHGTKAAAIFSEELRLRTGCTPEIKHNCENVTFGFILKNYDSQDEFSIEYSDNGVLFFANGIRGFIYAFSVFLKKCRFTHKTELTCDISGKYSPVKSIRGHQLGYRTTPNSYDAWSYEDYRRYYLDLMFMGCNMVEHIPYEKGYSNRNRLMKYDEEEFLVEACRMADEINLDVSLWYPNRENEDDEKAAETRKNLIKKLPRVNVIFPPGGDPGSLPADVFVKRCIAIKEVVNQIDPDIEMWPSAQAPHEYKNWGEVFIESLKKTDSVDGIIMGPNHAYPIEELRRKVPAHLPIRFYPDITHNVRCEYPVHFDKDDWHYALCAGLGRECTNPRPMEYAHLHSLTKPYVCGSVSYSEGITDDVNKFIWSSLDFGTETDVREILLDYARLFFYGAPEDKIADAILCLEIDWACDPALNPTIESTYNRFVELREKYSFLNGNWRFDQLLFRAECDMLLRTRRIFENNLVKKAKQYIKYGKISQALTELETDFCDKYKALRKDIDRLAEKLFNEIGLQLDVENYCA